MHIDPAREARLFVAAAALLTRVPVPRISIDVDWLPRAARYFPALGALLGLAAAAVLLAAGALWPRPIPDLLAVVATLLLTGAFHEDGLADTFDSLGGWTRAEQLAIMKDSRLGTFGAVALLACLALQVAALAAMPLASAAAALLAAHAGGRLAAVIVMAVQPRAGEPESAKVSAAPGPPGGVEIGIGAAFVGLAVLPLAGLAPMRALAALALGSAVAAIVIPRICRSLGGHTGDVLGATTALFMTGALLGAAGALGVLGP